MRISRSSGGFSLIELMIASLITSVVMGVAFSTFDNALALNETVVQMADSSQNLRAGTNLLVRDLLQAGRNIPTGGISIPSVDADPIQRPGPPGTSYVFNNTTATALSAITTGAGLGPTVNGRQTDMITIVMDDPFLAALTLSPSTASGDVAKLAADGSSFGVGPDLAWLAGDPANGVAPCKAGDLIYFLSSTGSTLQTITSVDASTVYFAPGDSFNLNQREATAGSITQILGATMTARRVLMYTYYVDEESPGVPRLMRVLNLFPQQALAGVVEALTFGYDLVDGVSNPTNISDLPYTAVVAGVNVTYAASQIRKVNLRVGVRSEVKSTKSRDYLRNQVSTMISLRNLAYVDRYAIGLPDDHTQRTVPLTSFDRERGVALITTLMILALMSALMIGFSAVVMSDQRHRFIDRDRSRAFYGAQSGIEKLNADLASLFFVNIAPSAAQITALANNPPSVPDVTFTTSGTGTAYGVTSRGSSSGQISTGPFQGLMAMKTTYELDASARTVAGGEAHLRRTVETVAIPVFQFGIFSEMDLSFHAGPDFNFGGRIHTNGSLFLAEGNNRTLTIPDKVTAVEEVIRTKLMNGVTIDVSDHEGVVQIATAPGVYRSLLVGEGSVVDSVGSALNDPTWTNISLSAYNGYIRNGRTGARALNLPLITAGGANPDLVTRPAVNEDATNPTLLAERYFSKVSLRILLSDTAADITSLPGVTGTPPVQLAGNWITAPPNNGAAYGPVDGTHPPIALSRGPLATTTIGGSTATTINAVPGTVLAPAFLPSVTLGGVSITCLGKTATSFTLCTGTPAVANGATVRAPSGLTTTTTAAVLAAAVTIPVVSTAAFTPAPMWNGANLITCAGWTAASFTSCSYSGAAPAIGVPMTTQSLSTAGTSVIGGFIKIERQDTTGVWNDVTMEILNYGIGGPNLSGTICADPTPNAIVRLQRLRDNTANGNNGTGCNYAGTISATDYWPNALFDTREALYRSQAGAGLYLRGVMYYVALDIANLSKWLTGAVPYNAGTGANSFSANGYSVYFSDRRNNRNAANQETGEYGFEDIINPADATGTANGVLDTGEDVNANGTLETYGQFPSYDGVANVLPPGAAANAAPFNAAATIRPSTLANDPQVKTNRAYLFRRALKLIRGGLGNIVAPGLTIAAENSVYIHGDWNASGGFGDADGHVATAVVADAVTLLSNNWNDNTSFAQPFTPGNRGRSVLSHYRVAIIAGKNMAFPRPGGAPDADFGTDGGAHNFLRMLESGGTVNYRGSIATFYHSRQAVGVYKVGSVYGAPTRVFNFDTDFLDLTKLPPLTPVFRDLNALGFMQETRPGK